MEYQITSAIIIDLGVSWNNLLCRRLWQAEEGQLQYRVHQYGSSPGQKHSRVSSNMYVGLLFTTL